MKFLIREKEPYISLQFNNKKFQFLFKLFGFFGVVGKSEEEELMELENFFISCISMQYKYCHRWENFRAFFHLWNKHLNEQFMTSRTLNNDVEGIPFPGNANSFSTPPVSFQCIKRLVGGAKSKVITISLVSLSWAFISSPDIFLTSSTISFRFLLVFGRPVCEKKTHYTIRLLIHKCEKVRKNFKCTS